MQVKLTDGDLRAELTKTELTKLSGSAAICDALDRVGVTGAASARERLNELVKRAASGLQIAPAGEKFENTICRDFNGKPFPEIASGLAIAPAGEKNGSE